ncbi:MAG: N-acetyltransferase family protein [Gammaproteobacteria bacterium]
MDVSIRFGELGDCDALLRLLEQLFAIESDFHFDEATQRKGLELMLSPSRDRCVMVAEHQGRVVAMATVQRLISTAEGCHVGLIEDLVVGNGYRGKGIGKKLLIAIEDWADRLELGRLQLLADRDNQPALRFYDRMEWSKTRMIGLKKLMPR